MKRSYDKTKQDKNHGLQGANGTRYNRTAPRMNDKVTKKQQQCNNNTKTSKRPKQGNLATKQNKET